MLQVVREKCKTCSRSFQPEELIGFVCPYCLEKRAWEYRNRFGPTFTGKTSECFECHKPILIGGYKHWDMTANTFALLCVDCSDKAATRAQQYRGTPYGYMKKAQ